MFVIHGFIATSHDPNHKISNLVLQALDEARADPNTLEDEHSETVASEDGTQRWPSRRKKKKQERHEFDLEILERVPNAHECTRLIRCKIPQPSFMYFLRDKTHPAHPTNGKALNAVVSEDPKRMKWPIAVNWTTGDIMVGKDRPALRALLRPLALREGQWPAKFREVSVSKWKLSKGAPKQVDWEKLR